MINLAPTTYETLAEQVTSGVEGLNRNIPIIGNAAICADNVCTAGRAGVNLYWCPNPVSKVFFGASLVCGVLGAATSGSAFISEAAGIPALGFAGSFGARAFNRLGKYTLYMGNITNGNITNSTEIADLMS